MLRPPLILFASVLASLSIAGEAGLRARLEADYARLGDEAPTVREAATERMLDAGVAAAAFVREKLAIEDDAEVEGRLLRVLRAIEREELVELEREAEESMMAMSALESRIKAEPGDRERLESDLEDARRRLERVLDGMGDRMDRLATAAPPEEPATEPVSYLRGPTPNIGDLAVEPKIDGEILFLGRRNSLVVISAGSERKAVAGMKFTVYRGERYVSKVVVTSARRGFALCREILDFRKEPPRKGDSVSTRVFD